MLQVAFPSIMPKIQLAKRLPGYKNIFIGKPLVPTEKCDSHFHILTVCEHSFAGSCKISLATLNEDNGVKKQSYV